jgi:predicted PurR-regulated permease PerM
MSTLAQPSELVEPLVLEVVAPEPVSKSEIASWLIVAFALWIVFTKHLVAALVAGLVFYLVVDRTAHFLAARVSMSRRILRPLAVLTGTVIAGAAVTGALALLVTVARVQLRNIPPLMTRMAEILESTRVWLTGFGYELLPEAVRDAEDLKQLIVGWLKEHAGTLGNVGESFGWAILHMIMAILLAAMVFLRHTRSADEKSRRGPLARHLIQKTRTFAISFNQVVSAQVKISAINTFLTAIYLLVALPLAGRPLPFAVTIVFITFVAGLIPVLGNLISNTVIVVVSLGISTGTAVASLTFLVVIHKLEYLINSRIVGGKTDSQVWEILASIIIGDALFGIPGIVMGPIVYTFIKKELKAKALV